MGKFKDLSPRKVGQINVLLSVGTLKQKEIAKKLNVSTQSVSNIKKKMENSQNLNSSRVGKCGRKRKTSSRIDRKIIKEALLNKRLSCTQISFQLAAEGVILARRTVNKRFLEVGLKAYRPRKKPRLTEWTSEQWEKMAKPKGEKPKGAVASDAEQDETFIVQKAMNQVEIVEEEEEEEEEEDQVEEMYDDEVDDDENEEEIIRSKKSSAIDKVKETKTKNAKKDSKVSDESKPKANLAKVMKAKGRNMKTGSVEPGRAELGSINAKTATTAKEKLLVIVLDGLLHLDTKKGVSFPALKKYVMETNDVMVWEKIRLKVKTALEKGIAENLIVRPKGNENSTGLQGSFKINAKTYNTWKKGSEKLKPKKDEQNLKPESSKSKPESSKSKPESSKSKSESSKPKPGSSKSKSESTKSKSETSKSQPESKSKSESSKSKSLKTTPKKALTKKVPKIKLRRSISAEPWKFDKRETPQEEQKLRAAGSLKEVSG